MNCVLDDILIKHFSIQVCTCVVHKRCNRSRITKCPGMGDQVRIHYAMRRSLITAQNSEK